MRKNKKLLCGVLLTSMLFSACGEQIENPPLNGGTSSTKVETPELSITPLLTITPEPTSTPESTTTPESTSTPTPTTQPTSTPTPTVSVTTDENGVEKVSASELVDVSAYSSVGFANGNVIPIYNGNSWGLLDYTGKTVLKPTYAEFWSSPNKDGYTVFADGITAYIVGPDGNVAKTFDEISNVSIDDDNIIFITQERYDGSDFGQVRFSYQFLDGTVLHDTGWLKEGTYANAAVPFNDGKAYLYLYDESSYQGVNDTYEYSYNTLYELTKQGIRAIRDDKAEMEKYYKEKDEEEKQYGNGGGGIFTEYMLPGYAVNDAYYLAYSPLMGTSSVIHPETGKEILVSSILKTAIPDVNAFYYEDYETNEEITGVFAAQFQTFKKNNIWVANNETYAVITLEEEDGSTKNVLFDFTKVDETGCIRECIAVYDVIYLRDFPYLAVEKEGLTYYIDFTGKVVSGPYYDATPFDENGYALVMEEAGVAYVINSNFEKVKVIDEIAVQYVGNKQNGFTLYTDEEVYFYQYAE